MMDVLSSLTLGFAPGFFWLWYFYRKDQVEPEPRHLVMLTFFFGCLAAGAQTLIRPWIDQWQPTSIPFPKNALIDAFLLTSLSEEMVKWLAFCLVILHHPNLDEPLDGLIYGIAVGLGFASVENVFYIMAYGDWTLSPIRGVTATLVHAACSGATGFFTGLVRFEFSRLRCASFVVVGLVFAVFFHGAYDFFIMAGQVEHRWLTYLSLFLTLPMMLLALKFKLAWARSKSGAYHGAPGFVNRFFRPR